MHFVIVGAGPAGLYLLKRRLPGAVVPLIERSSPDEAFGFGGVFSEQALGFLREDDPDTYKRITPHLESWQDIVVAHRGEMIRIDGVGFAAIGRLRSLRIQQERARSVGIQPVYHRALTSVDECGQLT
jgi:2-polyprenyl-6-methoxyphenol hydroxylase-like FAD-dependent oxidoreductase